MRGVWKRSHGRATKAPPDERGGNRHAQPKATAPHSYSTDQRFDQVGDLRLAVRRRRRDAQALGPLSHGGIVDRLNVDCVPLEQELARRPALLRVANEQRHDMRRIVHHRQASRPKRMLDQLGHRLMPLALGVRTFEVLHRRRRAGGGARRHCRGEDERRHVAAHGVDHRRARRSIATQRAKALGSVPSMTSMRCASPSRSLKPPPRGP